MNPEVYPFQKEEFMLVIFEISKEQDIVEEITSLFYLNTKGNLTSIPLNDYFDRFIASNEIFKLVSKIDNNEFELLKSEFSKIKTYPILKEITNLEFKRNKKYFIFQRNN